MTNPTGQEPTGHRPINLYYSTEHVTVVPEPIAARPSVVASIQAKSLTTTGSLTAGPLRLTFPDSETVRFWASALTELAAQLAIAEAQAAALQREAVDDAAHDDDPHTEHDPSDYDVLDEIPYEAQDHYDDAALAANDELRKAEA